jgi:hypothetical protein
MLCRAGSSLVRIRERFRAPGWESTNTLLELRADSFASFAQLAQVR